MQYFEADVHIKNPIKNSYQVGLGRTTQILDHAAVVHILIQDKRSLKLTNIVISWLKLCGSLLAIISKTLRILQDVL